MPRGRGYRGARRGNPKASPRVRSPQEETLARAVGSHGDYAGQQAMGFSEDSAGQQAMGFSGDSAGQQAMGFSGDDAGQQSNLQSLGETNVGLESYSTMEGSFEAPNNGDGVWKPIQEQDFKAEIESPSKPPQPQQEISLQAKEEYPYKQALLTPAGGEGTQSGETNVEMKGESTEEAVPAATVTCKHPCMALNEKTRNTLTFVTEQEDPMNQGFLVYCDVEGKRFYGQGRNKKLARTKAAQEALLKVFNMTYDPSAPPDKPVKSRKRKSSSKPEEEGTPSTPPGASGDAAEGVKEEEEAEEGEGTGEAEADMLGKRADSSGGGGGLPKKKRRIAGPPEPKNALMHLNELRPGTQFTFVSQTGPVHAPVFVMSVEVNQQTFHGRGNSKKHAKLRAAEQALKSFLQFPDASEAHQALGRGFLPSTADFTTDADVLGACQNLFSDFSGDNGDKARQAGAGGDAGVGGEGCGDASEGMDAESTELDRIEAERKLQSLPSRASNKNPVMVLNEIHRGVKYEMVSEVGERHLKLFNMKVTVGSREFAGSGRSKKMAKYNAALNALKVLHGINHFKWRDLTAVNEEQVVVSGQEPQMLADHIAHLVLHKFGELTQNHTSPLARRKVLAGIVMTTGEEGDPGQVVCLATGTKCINGEYLSARGQALNDCHAEVLCRRLLMRFLYQQLKMYLDDNGKQQTDTISSPVSVLEPRPQSEGGGFCLKDGIKFHLYISTAPCGDSRIFSPHDSKAPEEDDSQQQQKSGMDASSPQAVSANGSPSVESPGQTGTSATNGSGTVTPGPDKHPNRRARGLLRTKIESGEGTIPVRVSGTIQTWDGVLQGERLLTMSCSDKITRWNVLGLQGALLHQFLTPIYLSSVVSGSWYHSEHMARGVYGRVAHCAVPCPQFRLNKPFLSGVSSPECRQPGKTPNFSVNWCMGDESLEVVNPTTGKTEKEEPSRLAKQSMFRDFLSLYGRINAIESSQGVLDAPKLYSEAKAAVMDYQLTKQALLASFQQACLGQWVKKPPEHDQFTLDSSF